MKIHLFADFRIITVLAVLGFVLTFPVTGARAQGIKSIRNCQTIVESGSYALAKAITATESDLTFSPGQLTDVCILIAADYVTLDLQGYAISGPGGNVGIGIGTDGNKTGVKVHSGAVTKFAGGVQMFGVGHTVEHINASDNFAAGIFVAGFDPSVNGHRIVGNTAIGNGDIAGGGVGIFVGCPSVVLDNIVTQNGNNLPSSNISAAATCTRLGNNPAP